MMYEIAVCDNDMIRRSQLIEMLHVLSNELDRNFQINRYDNADTLLKELEKKEYNMIFINIIQAGSPRLLEYAQDIHIKNPNALMFSLCPADDYKYYKDIAKEFTCFKGMLRYHEIKNALIRAIKCIDLTEQDSELRERYAKIQLKMKIDYVELDRITYVEKKRNYVGIHTIDRSYYCYSECIELFDKLSRRPEQFIQVAYNYYINFYQLYGMEKVEGSKKFWLKRKSQYYAVMVGYKQVPMEAENYDFIFQRFVDEIIKNNQKRKLVLSY